MNRRTIALCALPIMTALFCAGCGSHPATTPTQPVTVAKAPAPTAPAQATFQPYTLIPNPAPKPRVAVKKRCVLHIVRRNGTIYLKDQSGRSFLAGRDQQGHLYPVYQSPQTHQDYPLYYDSTRDNYYREAQADNGGYYRNYVGDPSDRYYENDPSQPYNDSTQPYQYDDAQVVDDDGYNYNSQPGAEEHHHGHQDDWLWAIPVIIGAYVLLNQHHHHGSPPNYQSSQNPGGAYGYQGSGGYPQGGYPAYPGNPNSARPYPGATSTRRQPFPAAVNNGGRPFPASSGMRTVSRATPQARPTTVLRIGGRPIAPGQRITNPAAIRIGAGTHFPSHPGHRTTEPTASRPTSRIATYRSPALIRKTAISGHPMIVRHSRTPRSERPMPRREVAGPRVTANRPPIRAARPIAAARRVALPAPRIITRPHADVELQSSRAIPRRTVGTDSAPVRPEAPARPRASMPPLAPRPAARPAPRVESQRPAPQVRPDAPRAAPVPRPAPRPAPVARTAPAQPHPAPVPGKPR